MSFWDIYWLSTGAIWFCWNIYSVYSWGRGEWPAAQKVLEITQWSAGDVGAMLLVSSVLVLVFPLILLLGLPYWLGKRAKSRNNERVES